MTDRKAMQQALEALKLIDDSMPFPVAKLAMKNLRERLAHCERCGKKLGGPDHIHTCSPQQSEQEPVASVPVHPRTGPLWAMTTDKPHPERLPSSYPLMALYTAPPQRKPDHIVDANKMVPFQDLAGELFVVAQISPADDGFSDTITRIEAWLRNHFSTPPQRKPLPEQEPVAWIHGDEYGDACHWVGGSMPPAGTNLYTAPPQRKPLTDEEIEREWQFLHDEVGNPPDHHDFARAIEAKLKEKNNG